MMYKNIKATVVLVGYIAFLQISSMNFAYAAGPSGTVWINIGDGEQIITVTDGAFKIRVNKNEVSGTIDADGNYIIPALPSPDNMGNITKFPSARYQLKDTTEVKTVLNGIIRYNGVDVPVTNAKFTLNGIAGTIDYLGNVNYNGKSYGLFNIPGVDGYQLTGQSFVANPNKGTISGNKDLKSWVDNLPSGQGRGDMNYKRGAQWQEFNNATPDVSIYQLAAWMKATNPSPREVFGNMVKYKIQYYTVMGARQAMGDTIAPYISFNFGRFASYDAPIVEDGVVTTKELYDAGLIQINPTGMGRGGFGSLDGIFNGDNVYEGAAAGWLNKGVMYADRYGTGTEMTQLRGPVSHGTDEQVYFSQKDLDEAIHYRKVGYWGPKDSGDMDIEFRKAGYVSGQGLNRRYTYGGKVWRNDKPTGPNIADPSIYKISSSGTTTVPAITKFETSRTFITLGESVKLTWTSTNSDKCIINGTVKLTSDSLTVSPTTTTTYTLVCSKGAINSESKKVDVSILVSQNPTCQNLYWFDSTSNSCGQKQFCGTYMYQGLQTFPTLAQCNTALNQSSSDSGDGDATSPNPYASSLSSSIINKLDTWINTKIVARSATMTEEAYSKFIDSAIASLYKVKAATPTTSTTKRNIINYLVFELQQIQDSFDLDSFFDSILN